MALIVNPGKYKPGIKRLLPIISARADIIIVFVVPKRMAYKQIGIKAKSTRMKVV